MKDDFLSNSGRLYVFFFISVFCSLLIKSRLVFIWYFVSVPLRKGHRGLEYQCSFVPVSFCIFDYLYWDFLHFWLFVLRLLVFHRLFCNIVMKIKSSYISFAMVKCCIKPRMLWKPFCKCNYKGDYSCIGTLASFVLAMFKGFSIKLKFSY